MTIALWSPGYARGYGGCEQMVNALLRRFSLQGLRTVLISDGERGSRLQNPYFATLPDRVRAYVDTFPNPLLSRRPAAVISSSWRYAGAALRWVRFLRRSTPQIVHMHLVTLDVFLLVICKYLFGYRLIVTFGGTDLWVTRESRLGRLRVRVALRCADAVTAVSEHMASLLRERFGRRDVICIANGVDRAELLNVSRQVKADVPADHFVFIGRLHPVKCIPLLIETFKAAIDAGCDRNLYIVGDGEERASVARLISRYRLSERIILLGAMSHRRAMAILARARCLLLTSRDEGCPNVVLEAMALGVPVIAASVGGVPELVTHGETGYLFAPEDTKMAAAHILELARDADAARALGCRGAEAVRRCFELSAAVDGYTRLYRSVLADAGAVV